jgi:hypothetical protein
MNMQVVSRFVIGSESPDFSFTSVKVRLRGMPTVLTEPLTTGQLLSLNNPAVPVLTTMTDLVQEQIQKPMTLVNDINITLVGTVLTFEITKTEVTFDRGGPAAPSEPIVETIEVDIDQGP